MINVAICDDVVATTGKIETMLHNIAKRNFLQMDTEVFGKENIWLIQLKKGIALILSFWI